MTVKGEYTALQGEPKREAGEDFQQDAAETPHIEDKGYLSKVLHSYICLLSKALRQERVYFGWQILGRALNELTLILNCVTFLVQEERGAEVNNL